LVSGWPSDFVRWQRDAIATELRRYRQLEPQPDEFQAEFKLSYYAHDLDQQSLDEFTRHLAAAEQDVEIVYSSSRDLDVLPAGVNKGTAAVRLARHWQIEPCHVFVCGDTGNDKAMYAQGFRGIVVGNAQDELRQIHAPAIYHARAGFAAGVLEGLEFWLAAVQSPDSSDSGSACR
jgi:sucrose-6F-phosphate phosphohydrolase